MTFAAGNKLEEGKSYIFKVHNIVTLQDERAYLILEDAYHVRHLLPSWFYAGYGIKQGQVIKCRVDKINCTGRIFLEPEHPYYAIGGVYEFRLISIQKNDQGKNTILRLADIFDNEIEVNCPENIVESINNYQQVVCKVYRIHKGKPVVKAKVFKENPAL